MTSVGADGVRVLLHLPTGTYLSLDGSASHIVDLLNEDPDPDRAATALSDRYDIPLGRARHDVDEVVAAVQDLEAPRLDRGRRPTAAGLSGVARTWWRLPWRNRMTVVEVTGVVALVEILLATASLDRVAGWLRVPLDSETSNAPGPDDLGILGSRDVEVYWATGWVLERWLYDATCLRRALVLGWFLRRRRPRLRLGMMDDGRGVAHAWIEIDGRPLGAGPVSGTFVSGDRSGHDHGRHRPHTSDRAEPPGRVEPPGDPVP